MIKDEILNIGLSLAMDFGKEWLQPITSRLAEKYPELSLNELEEYNSICKSVMESSNKLVYSMAELAGKEIKEADWEMTILTSYAWINEENLKRLFSQGMYYAWKDGLVG